MVLYSLFPVSGFLWFDLFACSASLRAILCHLGFSMPYEHYVVKIDLEAFATLHAFYVACFLTKQLMRLCGLIFLRAPRLCAHFCVALGFFYVPMRTMWLKFILKSSAFLLRKQGYLSALFCQQSRLLQPHAARFH